MNFYLLSAGILAFLAMIGHFVVGTSRYLDPVLKSDIPEVPKRIMQGLFHYASVVLIVTCSVLLWAGFNTEAVPSFALRVIGMIYVGFAIVQLLVVAFSKVPQGILKLFQWVFWGIIALLITMGT